jgi:hypothetical protein
MIRVSIPVGRGNDAIADGTLQKVLPDLLGEIKPEAAYFLALDGQRTALIFCDLADASQIPALIEPFFMALEADVDVYPVMNADDLARGIAGLQQMAEKYLG